MKFKQIKGYLLMSAVVIGLLIITFFIFNKRLKLLNSYCQLIFSSEMRERLNFRPAYESFDIPEDKVDISIGYAEFANPFISICRISNNRCNITIDFQTVEIILLRPTKYGYGH